MTLANGSVAFDHHGRTVLVTGGANGLGRVIAEQFAASGAAVVAADIATSDGVESVRLLPGVIDKVRLDVANEDSVRSLVEEASRRGTSFDVLVNNAGVMYKAAVQDVQAEHWRRALEVNVTGAMLCAKHVVPGMRQRGFGRLINISSMTAMIGMETYGAYSSSKAALGNLSRVWAAELAGDGITANSLCPGWLNTPMAAAALVGHLAQIHGESAQAARERLLRAIPQRRLIEPEEVAAAAMFLATRLAAGINGAAIQIDTGLVETFAAGLHRRSVLSSVAPAALEGA